MCLISKWRFPKRAEKDIVCYKLAQQMRQYGAVQHKKNNKIMKYIETIFENTSANKEDFVFNYNGKKYNIELATERDNKKIIEEAESSHKEVFNAYYDKESLYPYKIRLFLDKDDTLIFIMIIYTIKIKINSKEYNRLACGDYYPVYNFEVMPHPFQSSICW